jgi:hypothetical protein
VAHFATGKGCASPGTVFLAVGTWGSLPGGAGVEGLTARRGLKLADARRGLAVPRNRPDNYLLSPELGRWPAFLLVVKPVSIIPVASDRNAV